MSGSYEQALRPLKQRFAIAALISLIATSALVQQKRSHQTLEKTQASLIKAESGLDRVKDAIENRRTALATMRAQFGQEQNNSPETILYGKVDELKARFNPNDMTIAAIEKKGGEASIAYTLTFINPEFNALLNTISTLQGSVFPLTPVSSVTIAQADQKGTGVLSCTVSGRIVTSGKAQP